MAPSTIPTLSGEPFLGNARQLRRERLALLERVQRECGEIGYVRFFGAPVVVISSPALAHEVLVSQAAHFEKSLTTRMNVFPLVGNGLFSSDGELWRRQRKLMAPLFQPQQVLVHAQTMTACIQRVLDRWSEGAAIDVGHEMMRIAMSVVAQSLLGDDLFEEVDAISAAVAEALEIVSAQNGTPGMVLKTRLGEAVDRLGSSLPEPLASLSRRLLARLHMPVLPTPSARRLREVMGFLDARLARIIQERRASGLSRPDLLSRLLAAQEAEGEERMSHQQLRDEVFTLFLAGHETTAVALTWALYLLARHPEAEARLQAEADGLEGRVPTAEDAAGLMYAKRVFKEAMRLYPPAPLVARAARDDVHVGPYLIRRRTSVVVNIYMIHRSPELWPEPECFEPDRFMPEAEAKRPRQAYLPFGAGPRICIGNHFALLEGSLALTMLAQRMSLSLEPGQVVEPGSLLTLRPRQPVKMRVHLRAGCARSARLG